MLVVAELKLDCGSVSSSPPPPLCIARGLWRLSALLFHRRTIRKSDLVRLDTQNKGFNRELRRHATKQAPRGALVLCYFIQASSANPI